MKRWKIAAGFLVMACTTAAAIAVAGGALGAGCSTGPGTPSACGVDAGADGASPAGTMLVAFCNQLAMADCSPAILAACSISETTCINAATASCLEAYYQVSPCNPGCLSYDEDYANDCVAAHQDVYASASFTAGDLQTLAAACLGVFNGGCLQAAVCNSDSDCDLGAGLVCVMQAGSAGTCQVPTPEMMGDPCTGDPTAQCIDNTYCGDAGTCAWDPDGGSDAGCSDDGGVPCFYDMTLSGTDGGQPFDVNTSRCVDGICRSKLFDDAGCADAGDAGDAVCVGGFCVAGICQTVYTFNPQDHPVGFPTPTFPGCAYFQAP